MAYILLSNNIATGYNNNYCIQIHNNMVYNILYMYLHNYDLNCYYEGEMLSRKSGIVHILLSTQQHRRLAYVS